MLVLLVLNCTNHVSKRQRAQQNIYKSISFTNFIFNNFITGVIHVRIFRSASRAHRLVIVHKSNGLPAEITCRSFFKIVKAHIQSISPGYCTVSQSDPLSYVTLVVIAIETSKFYDSVIPA